MGSFVQSFWRLIKETCAGWNRINAPRLGAALAYYTMLSTAPLVVLSIAIAGMVFGAEAARGQVLDQIRGVVGYRGAAAIQGLLQNAAKPGSGMAAAGAGVLVLFWGASGVLGELRDSLNAVWGVEPADGEGFLAIVRHRFVSFAMVLGIGFLLLVSLLLSAAIAAAGKMFAGALPAPEPVLQLINLVFSFGTITVLFALLYKLVPDVHVEWRDVWIGAAVTALLFSLGKFAIGLYLGKAGIGSAYGAAGSLVAYIVWVYYSAQIFFFGAQFTRTFAERHGSHAHLRLTAALPPPPAETPEFRNPRLA
jgi:membrane protein